MAPFYTNTLLTTANYLDFVLRILAAMICGGLIGYEREKRLKNAGLRTHIIVALASSLMMIVSKYAFMDVVGLNGIRLQADASRIASAVVQAIGFIGAGVIYVRKGNVIGLTTAAGLWATVGIGMAIGAGLWGIGVVGTVLILLVQMILHSFHSKSHSQNCGQFQCNITKHNISIKQLTEYFNNMNFEVQDLQMTRNEDENIIITGNIIFPMSESLSDLIDQISKSDLLDNISIYPVF